MRPTLTLSKESVARLTRDQPRAADDGRSSVGTWACTWIGCSCSCANCG